MPGWRATLETLPSAVLHAAATSFGIAADSLVPVRTGANAVWRGTADGTSVALRINHADLRGRARFALAVAWQAWLARPGSDAQDVVPAPRRDARGRLVVVDEAWLVSACAWAPGAAVGHACADPAVFRAWGQAIARMHGAAQGFPALPVRPWYHWQEERAGIRRALAARNDPALDAAWAAFAPRLAALPAEACCLTHGDQNAGNAILDAAGAIRLIDHDEPMWGWPLADLVRPMAERLGDHPMQWQALQDALCAGWLEGGGALPAGWREQMNTLLAFKLWNGLLWRAQLSDEGVSPLPDEFMANHPARAVALTRAAVLGAVDGLSPGLAAARAAG